MPEVFGYHQLQSLCRTGRIAGDHWITRHDLVNRRCMRIETLCSDLPKREYFVGLLENICEKKKGYTPYMLNLSP